MLTPFFSWLRHTYWRCIIGLIMLSPLAGLADDTDDPFPNMGGNPSGDVVQTAGTHLETALKYSLIGGGGLLIIICLAVIIHRLREDSKEKDHGNLVMTFILLALGLTLGFVLIGIGWTAFSTTIQS